MKAGALTAHRMIAVSHGYAWECQTQEGGWGLHGVFSENSWKLRGAAPSSHGGRGRVWVIADVVGREEIGPRAGGLVGARPRAE